ncbi:fructose-1,6-bisphosphatase/inositol monophosphatase family enzyme [Streptomyces sp. SAI-127]|nr:fructose-1,6-bisphosphatase/inositol monophosphatase family enzyme [Streptomyces sp. SAI-127]
MSSSTGCRSPGSPAGPGVSWRAVNDAVLETGTSTRSSPAWPCHGAQASSKDTSTGSRWPLTGDTYTAVAGGGARLNDRPLKVSAKTDLGAALIGTGQAKPGEDERTFRRIGGSVTAMLINGLVVRVSVPATMQLIHVAAGRMDAFWQFSDVRSGLVAGALLVSEAGGTVTDLTGDPWNTGSRDFLAAAPGLHSAALKVLSPIA